MSNLLSADFSRLLKSKLFYLALGAQVILSMFVCLTMNMDYVRNETSESLLAVMPHDYVLNYCFSSIIYVMAFFICMFIGREFKDGTARNKLIIGHSRFSIYLSKLIVCTAAFVVIYAISTLLTIILLIVLYGGLNTPFSHLAKIQLIEYCIIVFYSAIFVMISMLIGSRTRSVIASILVIMAMYFAGSYVQEQVLPPSIISEVNDIVFPPVEFNPEAYAEPQETPSEAELEAEFVEHFKEVLEKEVKVHYLLEERRGSDLSGAKRIVFLFLSDILPECQKYDIIDWSYNELSPARTFRYVLSDCCLAFVISAVGVLLFRRKELK